MTDTALIAAVQRLMRHKAQRVWAGHQNYGFVLGFAAKRGRRRHAVAVSSPMRVPPARIVSALMGVLTRPHRRRPRRMPKAIRHYSRD